MTDLELLDEIKNRANELKTITVNERRIFHQFPELSFQEEETSSRIDSLLKKIGFENVKIGVAGKKTGVVAELSGRGGTGKTIALRADIDALPIQEENKEIDYASKNKGVMHACGHDAHTATLLTVARILFELRDRFPGKVRFIFQPAEEMPEISGARAMIEEGVLTGVDAIFGIHYWSPYATGKIGFSKNKITAASDKWTLKVKGLGGHASMPHLTIDPMPAACNFVTMLQNIVSREIDPGKKAIITAAGIHSGSAFNIISDECTVQGTVRAFEQSTRELIAQKIKRVADGVCNAMGCEADLDYFFGLPPTVNDKAFAEFAAKVAADLFSSEQVVECSASMGAEDMGLYLEKVPGAYFLVGSGNEVKNCSFQHHTSRFNIDEDALPVAVALISSVAIRYLTAQG